MIDKILNKIDKLDMVYVLRLCALIVFLTGFFSLAMSLFPYFKAYHFELDFLWGGLSMTLVNIYRFIFEIAVLLGLAELIKKQKENKK